MGTWGLWTRLLLPWCKARASWLKLLDRTEDIALGGQAGSSAFTYMEVSLKWRIPVMDGLEWKIL